MPFLPDHPLWLVVAGLLGACIGSFLNVVIYRVPREMKVSEPKRSFCPGCKKDIPWYWNIPIVSWLLLRGKCRGCGGKIAFHYVAVEALTCVLFILAWMFYSPAEAVLLMIGISLLLPVLWIDAEHMVIPTNLTWAGSVVGLLGAVFAGGIVTVNLPETGEWTDRLLRSGLGWVAGFGILSAIILLGKVLFGRVKMDFETAERWYLREPETDEEQLQFVVADESLDWGEVFFRKSDRILISGSSLTIDGESVPADDLEIYVDEISAGGKTYRIEDIRSAEGTASHIVIPREAMGAGDPHLLGMLGAFFGWQSMLLIIMGSCVTALAAAFFARVGLGKPLPYGPFLIAGGVIWICGGWELWDWYLQLTR